jgi:bifunctional non-homologous end joining protein LigD
MSLKPYHEKRNFHQTPEPKGGIKDDDHKKLQFVIHKHEASHLHYDLRLELNGVLKSWAIPKGPSLNPEDKRLAIMVEDHPYDYKDFEGVIPRGNYGAGTVMIWDQGTYEPISKEMTPKHIEEALKKGRLSFILHGKKLNGEFTLVRFKKAKEDNSWFLIKKFDEFAHTKIKKEDESAASGKTMEEIQLGKSLNLKDAEEVTNIPEQIKPMLAMLVEEPFDRKDWIFEIKWDGYRAIADMSHKKIRLYSRNGVSFNDRFYPIVEALESVPGEYVLDGEIVVVDDEGRASFQQLQNYMKTGVGRLMYYVFDILFVNHCDLRNLPLIRRKEILRQILPKDLPTVKYVEHVEKTGTAFFHAAVEQGIEGIVAKEKNSSYKTGKRSLQWQKVKILKRQDAVIGGYTEPKGSRKHLGAVILGVYDKGALKYIGHTGGGYGEDDLQQLHTLLKNKETKKSPFNEPPKPNAKVHWLKPELVCEVSYSGWTKDGILRQPILLGLREDKNPEEVVRENGTKKKEPRIFKSQQEEEKRVGKHRLKLTHLDKIFWPKEQYSKGDLLQYYEEIAPYILPYLKDRPESLNRFPNGIEGESFYQKDVNHSTPDWVQTVSLYSESGNKTIRYAMCQDKDTLLYLANLGCIEMNPWNSRYTKPDFPDYLVLDIDPEGVGFKETITVALATHDLLEKAKIKNFCKTSGATGLHIYVPLESKYHYDQVRDFEFLINTMVHQKLPDLTSLERKPEKRQQKIYLDYLQNRRGQTMASAYSLRPREGAPVSTPLRWDELKPSLKPNQFHIHNILKRIKKVGDLWEETIGKGINMEESLKRLDRLMKKGW